MSEIQLFFWGINAAIIFVVLFVLLIIALWVVNKWILRNSRGVRHLGIPKHLSPWLTGTFGNIAETGRVGGFRFKVPGMFCRCPQRREMAADGADVQTVLIQRDGSFVTYQVRMAAAVCTFLMICLVVSWELFNFALSYTIKSRIWRTI